MKVKVVVQATTLRPAHTARNQPVKVVQRVKAVKVLYDNALTSTNKIVDVVINTKDLRDLRKAVKTILGDKADKGFVDRHVLDIDSMAQFVAHSYRGKQVEDVLGAPKNGISYDKTEQAELEKLVAKDVRDLNNRIMKDLDNKIEACWHFWGDALQNSDRNNAAAKLRAQLREELRASPQDPDKIQKIRDAIVFTLYDTPAYTSSPWVKEHYFLVKDTYIPLMQDLLSKDPLFTGYTIPPDVLNKTPLHASSFYQEEGYSWYVPGTVTGLYGK